MLISILISLPIIGIILFINNKIKKTKEKRKQLCLRRAKLQYILDEIVDNI